MDALCDFCSEHHAVLYCRADSARLCLFCDRQVHSANLLSRKHIRSLICENCGREPVTVRCATDKLSLCQDCDWDAHGNCSVSANHQRTPVEGFSGCPAARELVSIWGFAIIPNADEDDEGRNYVKESNRSGELRYPSDWTSEPWGTPFGDVMVPNSNPNLLYPIDEVVTEGCGYGRSKYILSKQLLQVYMKDCSEELASDGYNIEEQNGNKPEVEIEVEVEVPIIPRAEKQQFIRKQTDSKKNTGDRIDNPIAHTSYVAKIWDFNSGKQRNQDESGKPEKMKEMGSFGSETSTSNSHSFWLGNEYDMINFVVHSDHTSYPINDNGFSFGSNQAIWAARTRNQVEKPMLILMLLRRTEAMQ